MASDLFERLKKLYEDSSLFVFQKGGIGTFSELTLVLDLCRKRKLGDQPRLVCIGPSWREIFNQIINMLSPEEFVKLKLCYYEDFENFKKYNIIE